MKLILVFARILLVAGVLPAGQPSLPESNDAPSNERTVQAQCENRFFRAARAKETTEGPEYQVVLRVASAFGRRDTPHFYIAEEGNNAAYIAGSSAVDGKGKIVISRKFIKLLANTLALEGILAHEMAHSVSDDGTCGCDQWIVRDPRQEKVADAVAATTVGYRPLRAFFLRIKETQGGRSTDVDDQLQSRSIGANRDQHNRPYGDDSGRHRCTDFTTGGRAYSGHSTSGSARERCDHRTPEYFFQTAAQYPQG